MIIRYITYNNYLCKSLQGMNLVDFVAQYPDEASCRVKLKLVLYCSVFYGLIQFFSFSEISLNKRSKMFKVPEQFANLI